LLTKFVRRNKSKIKMNKKYLFVALFTAALTEHCLGDAASSTNSVAALKLKKPPKWDSSITLGLTATAGNSDSVLFTGKVGTHRKTAESEWTLGADGAYGETDSVKNNESAHAFVQYNHLFSERLYGYIRLDGLHDDIANVTYRFNLNPGVGYYFIKEKQTTLAGEVGPGVEYQKLDSEYDTYATLRLAERFEHKFSDHARIWQNVEILPVITDPHNYLLNAEIGVETALTHTLSLQVYVQDNYANVPAPGFKKNDVKLVSGLTYNF
jgi:putative salt-induced outer membrane protein YdiY